MLYFWWICFQAAVWAEWADAVPVTLLQVQLLISAQDVENYKVIKSELDKLRMMVEKSELWVEKKGSSKGEDGQEGEKKEKKEVNPEQQQGKGLQNASGLQVQDLGEIPRLQTFTCQQSRICQWMCHWQGAAAWPGSLP